LESTINRYSSILTLTIYYLGIGLTVIYSLRLTRLLFFSQVQSPGLCSGYMGSVTTSLPLSWLLFFSIAQGSIFKHYFFSPSSILCCEDKFVV